MFVTVGCFNDIIPVNDDGETSGDEPAPCWCATVEGAELDPPMGPDELVSDPDNGGGSPKACLGASLDIHAGLEDIDMDSAVVTAMHDAELISFRDDVFAAAENYCDALADLQEAGSTNDCNSLLIDGTSPLERDEGRMCLVEDAIAPDDSWSDYYSLTSVITDNSGTYEIDEKPLVAG
jgi:hypothetical protein